MEFMVAVRFPHIALQTITSLAGNNVVSIHTLMSRII